MSIVFSKFWSNNPKFTNTIDGINLITRYDYPSRKYESVLINQKYCSIFIAIYSTENRSKIEAIHNRAFTELKTMMDKKIYNFRKDYNMMEMNDFRTVGITLGDFCLKLENEINEFDVIVSKLPEFCSTLE